MLRVPILRKLQLRRRFEETIDQFKRVLRVGNYWYWMKVPELENGIEIASLVCPLRYDVLVRRDFFSFYSAHRDLYRSDFNKFVELANETSYAIWYRKSEAVRIFPHLLGNEDRLWVGFVDRVRRAAALYESLSERGFDRRYPITLRTGERLLPPTTDRAAPPTGKTVSARFFQAIGCHRLAMLMYLGYTILPAEFFRVQCFREFSPFDSTSLLARSLPIQPSSYFAYMSSYYCAPQVFERKDDFLRYIRTHKPFLLKEVHSVIRVDGFDK